MWILLLLLLWGCGNAAPSSDLDAEPWNVQPELRIGSVDAPDYSLTYVEDLEVGPDGRIYVLQSQEQLIRVFDGTGKFVGTIGRRGAGPGEFVSPYRMGWRGDTLWVIDGGQNRISFFGPDGAFLGSLGTGWPAPGGFGMIFPWAVMADGSVLGFHAVDAIARADGLVKSTPYFRIDREGRVTDTLAWVSLRNSSLAIRDPERPWAGLFAPQPFGDSPLVEAAPDGSGLVLVERWAAEAADRAHFTVTRIDPSGRVLFSRQYRYPARPMPKALADSVFQAEVAIALQARGPNLSSRAQAEERVREALYLPGHLPPITGVVIGRDGTIWLRREDLGEASVEWLVLGEDGGVLGALRAPRGLRILRAQRGSIWGVEEDTLGVPYVVKYRVEEEEAGRA
ncbi:MAG TPA: 6-bladed beta-propeller [Longimicrobiales bacterium]